MEKERKEEWPRHRRKVAKVGTKKKKKKKKEGRRRRRSKDKNDN